MNSLLVAALSLALPFSAQSGVWPKSELITVPNTRIVDYGPEPAGSGILHTWRKIIVLENGLNRRDLWVTWLGAGQPMPAVGRICTITYHKGAISGAPTQWIDPLSQDNALLDGFICPNA